MASSRKIIQAVPEMDDIFSNTHTKQIYFKILNQI